MTGLDSFCNWVSHTSISQTIQDTAWIIPIVQSIHIFSIGVVLTSIAMFDLQLAGIVNQNGSLGSAAQRFLPWVWFTLAVLLASGAILVVGEPARELANRTFWLKMGLLLITITLTALLERIVGNLPLSELPNSRRRLVRRLSLVSLTLWIAVLICGRGIAYTADPGS